MKNLQIPFFLLFLIASIGCSEEKIDYDAENDADILAYIADNNLDALPAENGMYYVVEKEGNGEFPSLQDEVTVHYHGTFLDGKVFDSSVGRGEPAMFPLTNVIQGWQLGIPRFSKGGNGILIIPSRLAYGYNDFNGIPGGSVLIFEVELIDF